MPPLLMYSLILCSLIAFPIPGCSPGLKRVYSNFDILCTLLPANFAPFRTFKLQAKSQIICYSHLFYLQITHYLASLSPSLTLTKPTKFKVICSQGPYQTRLISDIYRLLQENLPLSLVPHSYMSKWSLLTQQQISPLQWAKIWTSTSKISRCVAQRETAYKVLFFWYRNYDSFLSPLCWRCGKFKGTHHHISWQCELIAPFWSMVSVLQQISDSPIPLDPVHLLLGLPIPGLGKALNKLASYVLLAAKRAIPACWLSTSPPTQAQLIQAINDICRMEHMTAMVEDTVESFDRIWGPWDRSIHSTSQ